MFVRFADSTFKPYERFQAFVVFDYMGFVGGIMGLMAGASVLSLVELIFFLGKLFYMRTCGRMKFQRVHSEISEIREIQQQRVKANQGHALYQLSIFVRQFLKSSDIHGVKFVGDENESTFGRIFWFIAVGISVVFCVVLTSSVCRSANLDPVAIRLDYNFVNVEDVSQAAVDHTFINSMRLFADSVSCSDLLSRLGRRAFQKISKMLRLQKRLQRDKQNGHVS
jgi:Amiloride-sensitive sodium channel